jgi:uncharacterized membrane protein YvbJ
MNCKNCKNPISNDSIFCEWCGTNQTDKKSDTITNKNSKNKALKYTVYMVLLVLSIIIVVNNSDFEGLFWIISGVILTIEFYVYLKKRFDNE